MCQVLWHSDVSYPLKRVIKSVRVAQKIIWSVKYTPISNFRLGNNFLKKLQTMCSSAKQVPICLCNCHTQPLWLLDLNNNVT